MPDTLAHMRKTAEAVTAPGLGTPHAAVELDEYGARWLLALLPIVERIANEPYVTVVFEQGNEGCRFCGGEVTGHYRTDPPAVIHHEPDCIYLAARALKEGP